MFDASLSEVSGVSQWVVSLGPLATLRGDGGGEK